MARNSRAVATIAMESVIAERVGATQIAHAALKERELQPRGTRGQRGKERGTLVRERAALGSGSTAMPKEAMLNEVKAWCVRRQSRRNEREGL